VSVPKLPALSLVAVVLVMARVNSSASAQSVCLQDGDPLSCYGTESRAISPDSSPKTHSDPPGSDTVPRSPARVWRGWPGSVEGTRDGWMMNGAPFQAPDGRTCWPHGDHVHCR
jgi:hypothetical protein